MVFLDEKSRLLSNVCLIPSPWLAVELNFMHLALGLILFGAGPAGFNTTSGSAALHA